MANRSTLKSVSFEGYKSIASCEVNLGSLALLIGRNGAGKSNFLDGLRFVHDAINTNLQTAAADHGGIGSFLRLRSLRILFRLRFEIEEGTPAEYEIAIVSPDRQSFEVETEKIWVGSSQEELVLSKAEAEARPQRRTLSLSTAAGIDPRIAHVHDFLRSMRFYDFSLPAIRSLQNPQEGQLLRTDGANLASVLARLEATDRDRYERMQEYLRTILPGLRRVKRHELGPQEGIQFILDTGTFFAQHMSTGTLLALAVLVALFQPVDSTGQDAAFVAIEEPERALHPAAVGVLFDAMVEASHQRQILVATQSPDLLDRKDVSADCILAVVTGNEGTEIGAIDEAARRALAAHLFTAGELVRLDQLTPDT
jgi:predicted ATPase